MIAPKMTPLDSPATPYERVFSSWFGVPGLPPPPCQGAAVTPGNGSSTSAGNSPVRCYPHAVPVYAPGQHRARSGPVGVSAGSHHLGLRPPRPLGCGRIPPRCSGASWSGVGRGVVVWVCSLLHLCRVQVQAEVGWSVPHRWVSSPGAGGGGRRGGRRAGEPGSSRRWARCRRRSH